MDTAIKTQLPLYMKSAGTDAGIYLVIWLKNEQFKEPRKYNSEEELLQLLEKNNQAPDFIMIKLLNCTRKISPSKIS